MAATPTAASQPTDEDSAFERLGRPAILMENSLKYEDFERLCQLDVHESNYLLSPKIRDAFLLVDQRMKFLLYDSPLMKLGPSPLDVLTRNAANSFAIDKYDHLEPERAEKFGLSDPTGEATFPLASYFNHNCEPNCSFSLDMSANIVVSTTTSVDADTELTISYDANAIKSPTVDHQSERSKRLRCKKLCRETWTFECYCIVP